MKPWKPCRWSDGQNSIRNVQQYYMFYNNRSEILSILVAVDKNMLCSLKEGFLPEAIGVSTVIQELVPDTVSP